MVVGGGAGVEGGEIGNIQRFLRILQVQDPPLVYIPCSRANRITDRSTRSVNGARIEAQKYARVQLNIGPQVDGLSAYVTGRNEQVRRGLSLHGEVPGVDLGSLKVRSERHVDSADGIAGIG